MLPSVDPDEIEAEEGKILITLIMKIPTPGDDDPLIIPEPLTSPLTACNNSTVYTDYGNDAVLRDWGLFASLQTEFYTTPITINRVLQYAKRHSEA